MDYTAEGKATLPRLIEELAALSQQAFELDSELQLVKTEMKMVADPEMMNAEKMLLKIARDNADLAQALLSKNSYLGRPTRRGLGGLDDRTDPETIQLQIEDTNDDIVATLAEREALQAAVGALKRASGTSEASSGQRKESLGEAGRRMAMNKIGVDSVPELGPKVADGKKK